MLLRLLHNLLVLPFAPLIWIARRLRRQKADVVRIRLAPRVVPMRAPRPRWQRWLPDLDRRPPTSLHALARVVGLIQHDPAIRSVLVELPPLEVGWAMAERLRATLAPLASDAGTELCFFLPKGGGHREAYVASVGDRVFMAPPASLTLPGLGIESRYLGPVLEKLGVDVEVFRRAEFKSAADPISRSEMTPENRAQLEALLARFRAAYETALAPRLAARGHDAQGLERDPFLAGQRAVDVGLVDALAYEDELSQRLAAPSAAKTGESADATMIGAARYLHLKTRRIFVRVRPQGAILRVPIRGAIHDGDRRGAALGTIVHQLRAAGKHPRALGVLLDIDSPGGSAMASDLLHREIQRVAEKLPVVALMGEAAASGGYYVAAPCRQIVASPLTLTGSIGVDAVDARFGKTIIGLEIPSKVDDLVIW